MLDTITNKRVCHKSVTPPLLLYLRNPRAKPFMFGFYNQRFL